VKETNISEGDERDGVQLVAVAAVIVRGSRILAMRRAPHKVGAGLWETTSGRVQRGEDPQVAIGREIVEETGLEVRLDPRPIDTYSAQRGGEPMIVIVYSAEHLRGEVRVSDEHDEYAWLSGDEFAERSSLKALVSAVRFALGDAARDQVMTR
jgi:8-oxo-dGTP diphosphatase